METLGLFLPQDKFERNPLVTLLPETNPLWLTTVYNPTSIGLSVATFPDELLARVIEVLGFIDLPGYCKVNGEI